MDCLNTLSRSANFFNYFNSLQPEKHKLKASYWFEPALAGAKPDEGRDEKKLFA